MLVVVAGINESSLSPASHAAVGGGGSGGCGCRRWWRRAPHRCPCVDTGQGGGVTVAVVPLVMPLLIVPVLLVVSSSSPSLSSLSLSPLSLSLSCRHGIGHGRRVIVIAMLTQGRVMLVVSSLCMHAVVGGGGC